MSMKNRTDAEILAENVVRAVLGLPKTKLTPAEKVERFGDTEWNNRDPWGAHKIAAERYRLGLPLSIHGKKLARQWLKLTNQSNLT